MSENMDAPIAVHHGYRKSLVMSNRKSLGTPSHRLSMSFADSIEPTPRCKVPENDDDAERRERHRERVRELQRNILNSPATPSEKRQSLGNGILGLTNAQLAEHYTNCMKLSAENKITVKNAFGLHLIDYMADLLKKNDGSTNFQMASCTLDASAKIYAYRVDCVHADVFKMVGGLGIAEEPKNSAAGDENGEPDDLEKTSKRRRKVKKSSTVEQNLKTLNISKLETGFAADALFLKMSQAFEEGGMNGLLANIVTKNDSCELLLDSSAPYHSGNDPRPPSWFSFPRQNLAPIQRLQANDEAEICPSLSKFSFIDQNSFMDQSDDIGATPAKIPALAFDLNSVPEPVEDSGAVSDDDDGCMADDQIYDNGRLDEECGNDPFSMLASNDVEMRDCAAAQQGNNNIRAVRLESTQDLAHVLAEKPSEYSYFDHNLLRTWAGPNHWRLRPFSHIKPSTITTDRTGTRKERIKKPMFTLLFLDTGSFSKAFSSTEKNKLSKKTIQMWDTEKSTLPEDLHYDQNEITHLFHKDIFVTTLSTSQADVNNDVGEYNYDNANDRENFCPDVLSQDSNDDCNDDDADLFPTMDETEGTLCRSNSLLNPGDGSQPAELQAFSGDNLVQQPYKVAKIEIAYAKTAKKIDVKKLKNAMWKILTKQTDENKENVDEYEPPSKMMDCLNFSNMYHVLPSKLSSTMAKNLSVPVAFVCLLHMANEKNLDLQDREDLTDFVIQQG